MDQKKCVGVVENGEKRCVDLQLKDFDLRVIPGFFVIGINPMSKQSQGETCTLTIFLSGTLEKQQCVYKIILASEGGQLQKVCFCVCVGV